MVISFVVSAKDDDVFFERQGVGDFLVELLSIRGHEDDFVVVALGFERGDAAVNRFDFHDHTRLSAEGIVVDPAMLVERIVAEVVDGDFRQTFLLGSFENRAIERRFQHFG